jgi:DNA invertase Pin-like site-specific DNA recombinase
MTSSNDGPLRAILYTRVSTGAQAQSGLGLTDQLTQATVAAQSRGWTIVHHAQDAGVSAKSVRKRPGLTEALAMLDAGKADVLVASKLDRLSRSVGDFANLMERAQKRKWAVVCLDVGVDTSTVNGEMIAGLLSVLAQWERKIIGQRTKASHQVRRARGQRAGQLPELPEATRTRIAEERDAGSSFQAIADRFNEQGVPTAREGSKWHASTVRHVVRSVALEKELAVLAAASGSEVAA